MAKKKISYQEAQEKLEKLVHTIENEEVPVDELSGMVKEALALIKQCKTQLKGTDEAIQKSLEQLED
jgi:exodeoxyribonuclease VII small subunit